jgi:hypothetical protein
MNKPLDGLTYKELIVRLKSYEEMIARLMAEKAKVEAEIKFRNS